MYDQKKYHKEYMKNYYQENKEKIYKKVNEYKEFLKCWNYRNLRIIPALENLSKSDKLNIELVDKYNIKDLLPI